MISASPRCNANAMHTTLISTDTLAAHRDDSTWLIADCRYNLKDENCGRAQYEVSHIAGAVFVNLAHDLAAPRTGSNGRHPLPSPQAMAATFGRLGISNSMQVIAYDQDAGAFASRLWWMLRYLRHDRSPCSTAASRSGRAKVVPSAVVPRCGRPRASSRGCANICG